MAERKFTATEREGHKVAARGALGIAQVGAQKLHSHGSHDHKDKRACSLDIADHGLAIMSLAFAGAIAGQAHVTHQPIEALVDRLVTQIKADARLLAAEVAL